MWRVRNSRAGAVRFGAMAMTALKMVEDGTLTQKCESSLSIRSDEALCESDHGKGLLLKMMIFNTPS